MIIERHWIEWVLPIIAGISIYICKKLSFFIYIVAMSALYISSYVSYLERSGQGIGLELAFVFAFNTALVGFFLIPAVREVYLNPRVRWWEADDRFMANFPASIALGEKFFKGEVTNISVSGLLLVANIDSTENGKILVSFEYAGNSYAFPGTVVRLSHGTSTTLGVRFTHDFNSKRAAKRLINSLSADGRLLASRVPQKEDGFVFWIKRLVTTGKGFMPELGPKDKK